MAKYTRAMQRYAFTQPENERDTFQEQVFLRRGTNPAAQQESVTLAADKNGRAAHGFLDTSWLFRLPLALREGYLRLGQNLLLASNSRELKTIVFTATEEQDEQVLVAVEFAAVLANDMGRRVLLVDGDVHQASLSRLLGRSEHLGLREALVSGNGILEAPLDSRCPGLVFLPSGVGRPDFVLHPAIFQKWERGVRESFDYVLINTPPLSQAAAGALLGKHADGVILVAQAERTDRMGLAAAKEQMEKAQCQILGVVLTHTREYLPHFLRGYLNSKT